jgi:hypothetical protein
MLLVVSATLGIWIVPELIAAPVPAAKAPAQKVIYTKSVVSDSVRTAVVESLLVVRHDTVKVATTLKDTTKAVRSDTTHGIRVDTLRLGRKK